MREFTIIESREDSRDSSLPPRDGEEDFGTTGLAAQLRRVGHLSLEALAASNDRLLRQLLAEEREEGE